MITSNFQTACPFPLPLSDLSWCRVAFEVSDSYGCVHDDPATGSYHIALADHLLQAVPKRRSEYLAGRLCAAAALRRLGLPETVGARNRVPTWPAEAVGSITHSGNCAIAVASRVRGALGVDYEVRMPEERARELQRMILQPQEAALRSTDMTFETFVTLVFSAKEALYKALAARVRRILEFHEVRLVALSADKLALEFEGGRYAVLWRSDAVACLTLVALPSQDHTSSVAWRETREGNAGIDRHEPHRREWTVE